MTLWGHCGASVSECTCRMWCRMWSSCMSSECDWALCNLRSEYDAKCTHICI